MSFRFVDLDHPSSDYPDFAVRKPNPTLLEMFYCFSALILAGMGTVLLPHDAVAVTFILFTVIGLASLYAFKQVSRQREKQRATEFQNALFASALAKGCRFCLIARKDGMIVYANPGFNALFPAKKDGYALEAWLADAKASPEGRKNILDVVERGFTAEFPVRMEGQDGQRYSLLLSVEPIERPKGFILLRAGDTPQRPV